jgi:hypothetical protein
MTELTVFLPGTKTAKQRSPYLRRRPLRPSGRTWAAGGSRLQVLVVLDVLMATGSPASVLLAIFLAAGTAGCSTSIDTYLVDPGQYSAYHCNQFAGRLKALQTRETDLRNLMEKASEGGGGTLIGGMSYRAEYEKAVGEEKVLRRSAADKKCALDPPVLESDQVIR